jgi:hypothetical protein
MLSRIEKLLDLVYNQREIYYGFSKKDKPERKTNISNPIIGMLDSIQWTFKDL